MSASLRDLRARVEALPTPDFDAASLVSQAGRRTRVRQAAACVAAGIVVALIAVGATTLDSGQDHSAPPATQDRTPAVSATPTRRVTYGGGYMPTTTIHYGNRTVELPHELAVRPAETGVVHMDVTDDGVAFTIATASGAGRGVWFTDGKTTHRIGRIHGYLGLRNNMAVVSGTAGSRVAWIEEPKPGHSEVVVYDTDAEREVARVPAPPCRTLPIICSPVAVVGDNHVYFVVGDVSHRRPDVLMRLDVTTGELQRVTADDLAADVADRPRGLILGESPESGLPTNGYGVGFAVRGARLVPLRAELTPTGRPRSDQDPVSSATRAFDTGTRRELLFRLPGGYDAADEYTAFEWLDDDRLALMNGANSFDGTNGDILGCRISTGRCDVLSPGKPGDVRVVPHLPLPG